MANSSHPYRSQPASLIDRIYRSWLPIFIVVFGIYNLLPFLAPVFMKVGWEAPARAIYLVYSFLCHQLPERSFFMFGPKAMYSLADLQAAGVDSLNPWFLRQFVGNPEMGWKVAWSDRMISLFGGIWLAAALWRPLLRRWGRLPWWGLLLLALPMALDGTSHFVSDLAGIGQGFRDTNAWLSALTNNALSPAFYAGDAIGSFNSWMRLVTGLLFALGAVWFSFSFVESELQAPRYPDSLQAPNQPGPVSVFQSPGQS